MNKIFFLFALVAFTCATTFAQDELFSIKIKKEAIPEVIIAAISEDFPDAIATEFTAIPITVIDDQVYVYTNEKAMEKNYDTYNIAMTSKGAVFHATYDKNGNLLSTSEYLKNTPLPHSIQTSIGRHFSGWAATDDKMMMSSVRNGKQKTHYKVELTKGKEHHWVLFDADGNIIRGADKAKPHRQIKFTEHRMKKAEREDDDQ